MGWELFDNFSWKLEAISEKFMTNGKKIVFNHRETFSLLCLENSMKYTIPWDFYWNCKSFVYYWGWNFQVVDREFICNSMDILCEFQQKLSDSMRQKCHGNSVLVQWKWYGISKELPSKLIKMFGHTISTSCKIQMYIIYGFHYHFHWSSNFIHVTKQFPLNCNGTYAKSLYNFRGILHIHIIAIQIHLFQNFFRIYIKKSMEFP